MTKTTTIATTTDGIQLYRITRGDAEHLMMAPAVSGGFCAVALDARNALGDIYHDGRDILAALPGSLARGRAVQADELPSIIRALTTAARRPVNSDDGSECSAIVARLRR